MLDLFKNYQQDQYYKSNKKVEKYCLRELTFLGRTNKSKKIKELRELLKRTRQNLLPFKNTEKRLSFLGVIFS